MLANFLNKTKPINIIGLLIFFFVNYFTSIFEVLSMYKFSFEELIRSLILIVFFLGIYFLNNFIINKNKLTLDNSYAYFVFTLILVCILPLLLVYNKVAIAIVYLLFLRKIYILKSPTKVLQKLFDGGFWLAILVYLDFGFLLFIVLIYSGIYLHQKTTINTLFAPVIGFLTPFIIIWTYYFWYDNLDVLYNKLNTDLSLHANFFSSPKYTYLFFGILILTFICLLLKSADAFRVNDTFRKNWTLIIINFIIAIFFLATKNSNDGSVIFYLLLPSCVIIANGIQLIKKKIVKEIFLYLLLISAVIFRFFL